jgi:hypothetical protein
MTQPDLIDVMRFDANLGVGYTVEVRWTSNHCHYRGVGTVTKLNACSLRVKLADAVGNYPAGLVVTVPRCTFRSIERWSWNNGVFPTTVKCHGCDARLEANVPGLYYCADCVATQTEAQTQEREAFDAFHVYADKVARSVSHDTTRGGGVLMVSQDVLADLKERAEALAQEVEDALLAAQNSGFADCAENLASAAQDLNNAVGALRRRGEQRVTLSTRRLLRRKPVPRAWREQHHYLTTDAHIAGGGWGGWGRTYRTRGHCSCGASWPDSPNADNLNYVDVLEEWKDHVARAYHGDDYYVVLNSN